MATLTIQSVTRAGLEATYAAASVSGDKFRPSDRTFLHVKNGSGGELDVTIATPREAFPGAAIADITVAVTAGEERLIGPFPAQHFASPSTAWPP